MDVKYSKCLERSQSNFEALIATAAENSNCKYCHLLVCIYINRPVGSAVILFYSYTSTCIHSQLLGSVERQKSHSSPYLLMYPVRFTWSKVADCIPALF